MFDGITCSFRKNSGVESKLWTHPWVALGINHVSFWNPSVFLGAFLVQHKPILCGPYNTDHSIWSIWYEPFQMAHLTFIPSCWIIRYKFHHITLLELNFICKTRPLLRAVLAYFLLLFVPLVSDQIVLLPSWKFYFEIIPTEFWSPMRVFNILYVPYTIR